jgi:hypothetical protein
MRLRSVPVVVLVILAVAAVYVNCHARGGSVEPLGVVIRLAVGGTTVAAFLLASLALRRLMGGDGLTLPRKVVVVGAKSGGGKFRVTGVDRASRMETTEFVRADSPERAKIQVDLKGVDVSTIERVPA